MDNLIVDRRDLAFLLHELLQVESLTSAPRYADHSRATFDAAIDSALRIAMQAFAPHNRATDVDEPRFDGERVSVAAPIGPALRAFADAGFTAATFDYEDGGMQLPRSVANACWSVFKGAAIAIDTYSTLSIGVANMLQAFGSESQKQRYLKPLLAGRFFGTMVLTEPQAGSSLADIRAQAMPRPDGLYAIKGHKVFITAGDHELGENIVHLVLARLPDAPAGVKGLSLFICPKFRLDGGQRNDVALAGLIHKLGSRGTTSAMLNFGERGDCVGELLGAPNQGLRCMFRMMNEARINVGLSASMLAYTGYLHALAYARERVQGRPDLRSLAVPIVRHADVRRMLLAQKCIAQGGLALCLFGAWLSDRHEVAASDSQRADAQALLDLLTPVIKAWCSFHGTAANSLAIQVHGGYGYTREYPVEQFFRDNRLNSIHEGTDGIQALDLLGRKVGDGLGMSALGREIAHTVAAGRALDDATLAAHAHALDQAWRELEQTTRVLLQAQAGDARVALAHASVYLDAFGHTAIAWMWLRQAVLAQPQARGAEAGFYRGKLAAAHFFFTHELPKTGPQHQLLRSLDPALVALDDAWL
ncbi:MAG TPA: acyl-CoA dehydrogenase [Albitalea sp.]|uniref:acyl-CoA dehydrogenase n=1 Tax=Piscinibacter sp. TaxID=1903157 RepID=UPI002ED4EF2A